VQSHAQLKHGVRAQDMTRGNKGLIVVASGVGLFSLFVSGVLGEISIFVAPLALLVCIVGIGIVLSTQSLSTMTVPHPWVLVPVALAVALHSYIGSQADSTEFSFWFLAWALSPYAVALLLSSFKATRASAVAGAVAALCVDALTFHSVFIRPTSSTASFALLFSPLWNFLIVVPGVTWLAWKLRNRGNAHAP
jgi:hypothetical protein